MGSNKSHLSSLRLKVDITENAETSKQTQFFRACGSTKADPLLLDGFYSSFSEAIWKLFIVLHFGLLYSAITQGH